MTEPTATRFLFIAEGSTLAHVGRPLVLARALHLAGFDVVYIQGGNLLDILAACGGSADGIKTYGALKAAVTDAVVAELEPIQKRYADLDDAAVSEVFDKGAVTCRQVTAPVLAAARTAMGLG